MDFAGPIDGLYYLIIVDAFTKWPEVFCMRKASTEATIASLQKVFSCFGLPDTITEFPNDTPLAYAVRRCYVRQAYPVHDWPKVRVACGSGIKASSDWSRV
ncbi:hypothetical protein T265_10417 [Opisthorchis viverrini]|uniref:Integrase catalytic domain-containing protein n=1 Tax=Opisthorchis viverrini TaxID=6198 RepID=A0A074Z6N7_OPIVI|nr:hypothetical protein T265_10417 [Opisthorchis viverrini]KER21207.1 hypothetical protein T265_10417 [Opisthorchis viverrini]